MERNNFVFIEEEIYSRTRLNVVLNSASTGWCEGIEKREKKYQQQQNTDTGWIGPVTAHWTDTALTPMMCADEDREGEAPLVIIYLETKLNMRLFT